MTIELTIIGIVFALILVIIFFSAIALYLAFRIKETFRKETRKGITIVKVAFLIGVLFLAGGIFYFFANTLGNMTEITPSPLPSSSPTPTPQPTTEPVLTLSPSYPSSVSQGSTITISFTIRNLGEVTAHDVTIEANELLADFEVISSTREIDGNVVNVGDVPSGATTVVSLQLLSPNRPGSTIDTISLQSQETITPITQQITITVRGGP